MTYYYAAVRYRVKIQKALPGALYSLAHPELIPPQHRLRDRLWDSAFEITRARTTLAKERDRHAP